MSPSWHFPASWGVTASAWGLASHWAPGLLPGIGCKGCSFSRRGGWRPRGCSVWRAAEEGPQASACWGSVGLGGKDVPASGKAAAPTPPGPWHRWQQPGGQGVSAWCFPGEGFRAAWELEMKALAITEGRFELNMIKRERKWDFFFFLTPGMERKELSLIECQLSDRFRVLLGFLTWRTLIAEVGRKLYTHLLILRLNPGVLLNVIVHVWSWEQLKDTCVPYLMLQGRPLRAKLATIQIPSVSLEYFSFYFWSV